MHPNPAFRKTSEDKSVALARSRGFGTLAVNAEDGPLLSHVPYLLNADATVAELHLVRSNPIVRLGTVSAVIAVSGPEGYVSPDWYGIAYQVPTWNYVAVHLRGTLERLPQDDMRHLLERQSAHFEANLAPKTPWTMDKMTPDVADRMMRQIVPFRLSIERIDATWKLNQNKDDAVRLRAADAIAERNPSLAALMSDPP